MSSKSGYMWPHESQNMSVWGPTSNPRVACGDPARSARGGDGQGESARHRSHQEASAPQERGPHSVWNLQQGEPSDRGPYSFQFGGGNQKGGGVYQRSAGKAFGAGVGSRVSEIRPPQLPSGRKETYPEKRCLR